MGEHGCRPKRVVLDYELKRDVQRDLARARKEYGGNLVSVREEVACKHNLPIVDNQIRFPDVRIATVQSPPECLPAFAAWIERKLPDDLCCRFR